MSSSHPQTTPQPLRLLLVDDHPVVRAGLRSIQEFAPEMQIVGEARTVATAMQLVETLRPDVVVLDVRLEGENGLDVCRQIKRRSVSIKIVVLSSYSDHHLVLEALDAGADGYLLKRSDTHELIAAIREVARGGSFFDPKLSEGLRAAQREQGALASLSPQERRLLAEIARGKTDKEAATALGLSPKTVRNYLGHIFTKLKVRSRTEAALQFVRSGQIGDDPS